MSPGAIIFIPQYPDLNFANTKFGDRQQYGLQIVPQWLEHLSNVEDVTYQDPQLNRNGDILLPLQCHSQNLKIHW